MPYLSSHASVWRAKSVDLSMVAPYYGYAGTAGKVAKITESLILGLQYRGNLGTPVCTMNFSVTAPAMTDEEVVYEKGIYGYFAYPRAWGGILLMDLDAPIGYGGWDSARMDGYPLNGVEDGPWGPVHVMVNVPNVGAVEFNVLRTDFPVLGGDTIPFHWSVSLDDGTGWLLGDDW